MLEDARGFAAGHELAADVCIIGAGAAGITIARELAKTSLQVLLLESGGYELDPKNQALYAGEQSGPYPTGFDYLVGSRLRFFGGTTNHWSGWCRPLDEHDFEERSWVPHSGWPFTFAELAPYYLRAYEVVEIKSFENDTNLALHYKRIALKKDDDFTHRLMHFSGPVRFGKKFRQEIVDAPNVRLVLHANAIELVPGANLAGVERLDAGVLDGPRFKVKAKVFVLACGGIENARLLLASNSVAANGLGNEHDLVGRYFTDHAHVVIGRVVLWRSAEDAKLYYDADGTGNDEPALGHRVVGTFFSTKAAQQRGALLNSRINFVGGDLLSDEIKAVGASSQRLDQTGIPNGFFADALLKSESTPNPESRVLLGDARDPFGKPTVKLVWRLTDNDRRSWDKTAELFGSALGAGRLGRMQGLVTPKEGPTATVGYHHVGTVRMHRDAKQGVADAYGRVHALDNLYVTGSGTFPTTGASPPTTTIVALALRLAD